MILLFVIFLKLFNSLRQMTVFKNLNFDGSCIQSHKGGSLPIKLLSVLLSVPDL